jgi:DNA-binding NarL/FixJ family response regulator
MTSILTPRQHQVLRLLGEGLSTREIAVRLVCAETTARNHVQAILSRLGCSTRLAAVLRAQHLGLL